MFFLDVADKFLDYVMLAESSLCSCVDQLIEEAAAIAAILQVGVWLTGGFYHIKSFLNLSWTIPLRV